MIGFRDRLRGKKERGAVIVLTALALPILLIFMGLALDLGNLYIHKARLQNAADAAALAGAKEYAIKFAGEAPEKAAAQMADAYVNENVVRHNLRANPGRDYRMQPSQDGNVPCYHVTLTEEVPLLFLRFIRPTQPITANAAAIVAMRSAGDGKALFIFRRALTGVNAVNRPDDLNLPGQLLTTFDGAVTYTDGSGEPAGGYQYDALQYNTQIAEGKPIEYFFTRKARDEGLSVNAAAEKQKKAKPGEYAHRAKYEPYDMAALGKDTAHKFGIDAAPPAPAKPEPAGPPKPVEQSATDRQRQEPQKPQPSPEDRAYLSKFDDNVKKISSSMLAGRTRKYDGDGKITGLACTARNDDGSVEISIDGAIPGGSDAEPVYVYLDKSITQVDLAVSSDNGRPLIVVYEGAGSLRMEYRAPVTFRGIVYAPQAGSGGVLVNANGGTFSGSIIADSIDLQGEAGTFRYEGFDLGGGEKIPDTKGVPRLVPR